MNLICKMFYLDGCKACEQVKEILPNIESNHSQVKFEQLPLYENIDLYKSHITEKEPVIDYARHEDGEIILDADGNPMQGYARNEDGSIKMDIPIVAPNFFVFNNDEFLGNIVGSVEQLDQVLTQLEQANE